MKKIYMWILIGCMIGSSLGFYYNRNTNTYNNDENIIDIEKFTELSIVNPFNKNENIIKIDKTNDINSSEQDYTDIHVRFKNNDKEKSKFIMNIFLNYKPVRFKINNVYYDTYDFNEVSDKSSKILKVGIPNELLHYKSNSIVISISDKSNKRMEILNSHTSVGRFEVLNENSKQKLKFKDNLSSHKLLEVNNESISQGIDISLNNTNNKFLHCKPKDKIILSVKVGGFEKDTQTIYWINTRKTERSTTSIGKDSKLSLVNVPKDRVFYNDIEIEAPAQKGTYIIQGYLSKNPYDNINVNEINDFFTFVSDKIFVTVE